MSKLILLFIAIATLANVYGNELLIENWKINKYITEENAFDSIYEIAYDEFIGDDGEDCAPEIDYAYIESQKNDEQFTVMAYIYMTAGNHWACRYLMNYEGDYLFQFQYNNSLKQFEIDYKFID